MTVLVSDALSWLGWQRAHNSTILWWRAAILVCALAESPFCLLQTGMDPRARRAMWGAILAATQAANVAVVLTTHSMEEVSPERGSRSLEHCAVGT